MAEDWDLWAVVRSCNTPTTPSAAITAAIAPQNQLIPFTQPLAIEEKENVLATTRGNCFEELEQIMNPNVLHPFDGNKSPLLVECEMTELPLKEPVFVEPINRKPLQSIPPSTRCHHEKKKGRPARVVEVEAEELLHVDPWNWRKYGTKPIKASPFPRHYYKCSSDGNKCNAKKHIERCHTHTDKFIVSYSGEHNHSLPSRRNALSCTTRKKPYTTRGESFPSPSSDLPPSTSLGEVGGDSENIYMGLEDFGGPKRACSVGREFDWIWNTNDDLSFPEQLSPPATNKSGNLPQF